MSTRFNIRSVLICDDVRREANGKEILIGLYNDSLLFQTLPSQMRQCVIRVAVDILDKSAKEATIYIKDPNDAQMWEYITPLDQIIQEDHPVIGFILQGLSFYVPGLYSIEFKLDNDGPQKISDFYVRLPQTEEEKKRLQSII
jgi:hypothetical protein